MKRFLAGLAIGWLTLALALLAQRPSDKIVPPQIVVDNRKVKVSSWILQPGERSPVHTHSLDHVYVVVHGSKIREFISDGRSAMTSRRPAARLSRRPRERPTPSRTPAPGSTR